jgi:hypothetical protein
MHCLITSNLLYSEYSTHLYISFATIPQFGVIAVTMEGSYKDNFIVAEDEAVFALSYLNINTNTYTSTRQTNALSNQQMLVVESV